MSMFVCSKNMSRVVVVVQLLVVMQPMQMALDLVAKNWMCLNRELK